MPSSVAVDSAVTTMQPSDQQRQPARFPRPAGVDQSTSRLSFVERINGYYRQLLADGYCGGSGPDELSIPGADAGSVADWRLIACARWLAAIRERASCDGLCVETIEAHKGMPGLESYYPVVLLACRNGDPFPKRDRLDPMFDAASLQRWRLVIELEWGKTLQAARERAGID